MGRGAILSIEPRRVSTANTNANSIFDKAVLEVAVNAQGIAYGILKWLVDAVKQCQLAPEDVHQWLSSRDTVLLWLSQWPKLLPTRLGAECLRDPDCLRMTSNMLASFLESTMDVTANPGVRTAYPANCRCDVCAKLIDGSHLRPNRLDRLDRAGAAQEKRAALAVMEAAHGFTTVEDVYSRIQEDADAKQALATVAYGRHLVRRCKGDQDQTATALVLWREFAWSSTGSPTKNFRLTYEIITKAETLLIEWLKGFHTPSERSS